MDKKTLAALTTTEVNAHALRLLERDINVRDYTATELKKSRMYGSRIEHLESEVRVLKGLVSRLAQRLNTIENEKKFIMDVKWDKLTPYNILIMQYVALGLSNKEIATLIGRKRSTVTSHLHRVSRIMGTTTRAATVAEFYRLGYIKSVDQFVESRIS